MPRRIIIIPLILRYIVNNSFMKFAYPLMPVMLMLACCFVACTKKSNAVFVKPATTPNHDSLVTNTAHAFPDTTVYIGIHTDTSSYMDDGGTIHQDTVQSPSFRFYVIQTDDTSIIFMNEDQLQSNYSINDTFRKNNTGMYVASHITNLNNFTSSRPGVFVLTGNNLDCYWQYKLPFGCAQYYNYICGYTGTAQ